jgi:hypothetical protein
MLESDLTCGKNSSGTGQKDLSKYREGKISWKRATGSGRDTVSAALFPAAAASTLTTDALLPSQVLIYFLY